MFMDRKIFDLNLSVEATSAYILVCNLAESGAPITAESAGTFWNDSPEALVRALDELMLHRVIFAVFDSRQTRQYMLNSSDLWQTAAE